MIKFFTAAWCTACQNFKQNLLPEDFEDVEIIDADNQRDEVTKYDVRSIPTLIKVDEEGNEVDRRLGTMSRSQFLEFVGE